MLIAPFVPLCASRGKTEDKNQNMKNPLREEVLAPYFCSESVGGAQSFKGVTLDALEKLISEHLVDMGTWNSCEGVAKLFLPFLRRNPGFTAHGYIISWERVDARVAIEGIEKEGRLSKTELIDFANTFWGADEVEIGRASCRERV